MIWKDAGFCEVFQSRKERADCFDLAAIEIRDEGNANLDGFFVYVEIAEVFKNQAIGTACTAEMHGFIEGLCII